MRRAGAALLSVTTRPVSLQAAAGVLVKAAGAWSASPADGVALQVDYLVATTHPDNRAQGGSKLKGEVVSTMREDILATCDKARSALRSRACASAGLMHARKPHRGGFDDSQPFTHSPA